MPEGTNFAADWSAPKPSLFSTALRTPPSNMQAEQALLGALFANNRAIERIPDYLAPEHFADPINGRIFDAIRRRITANQIADPITLKAEFEHSGLLDDVGGFAYLAQLLSSMVGIINVGDYGLAIHDAWLRRQLIDVGEQLVNGAFGADPERDGHAVATAGFEALLTLGQQQAAGAERVARIGESMHHVMAQAEAAGRHEGPPAGLLTGLPTLDACWRGLWPGTLDILAGRPGAGKTALALQIGRRIAERFAADAERDGSKPRTVDFWSLEMSADQLAARALSMETGIPADDIRHGTMTTGRAQRLVVAQRAWSELPLVIHDDPRQTLAQITMRARIAARRTRCGLVIVDHAGKVQRDKAQMRLHDTEWLSSLAGEFHDLALAIGVPVLLLWHLSREGERRDNPRPLLSDLKYAGEGDADNVLLLWRPERHLAPNPKKPLNCKEENWSRMLNDWNSEQERWAGKAEVIFAKRRSGPEGAAILSFDGASTRFGEVDEPRAPGAPNFWGEE